MTDGVGTTISGGLVQGVVGAGTVHIENLVFNNYGRDEPSVVAVPDRDAPIPPNPYPGLAYFGPDDNDVFFGREDTIGRLAKAVGRQGFTSVVGPSGCGKSSVVLAGLAPYLHRESSWSFGYFRVGTELNGDPFAALARVLVPLYVDASDATERLVNTRKLAGLLSTGALTLSDVLAEVRSRNKGRRILLIADQFEEVFTTIDDEALRQRFLGLLLQPFREASAEASPQIAFVATLRGDFYGRALQDRQLADLLQDHVENIGPMTRSELESAIRSPAAKRGTTFEAGLVETLLDRVEAEPGALPLLQFALRELWGRQVGRTMTRAAYDDIGGVEGALAKRAEGIYADEVGRIPSLEDAFRRLFTRLVAPGEGQADTRRVVARTELGDVAWALAQRLAEEENRLVVTSAPQAGREQAELSHEALIGRWPRLTDWLTSDRAFRSWLEDIRRGVARWTADRTDDGPLLRGGMLAQASDWIVARGADFSMDESSFVEASLALETARKARETEERERELQRQRELAEASERARVEAERRADTEAKARKQSVGRQLSASAENLASTDYGAALLLAVEATEVDDTIDARGTLLDLVRRHPRIVAYLRPPSPGRYTGARVPQNPGVAFHPDGRILAALDFTGGSAVHFWDAVTHRRLGAPLAGHEAPITCIRFSDDGRLLGTAAADGVALWSMPEAVLAARLTFADAGQELTAETLVFDGRSEKVALGTNARADGTAIVRIWDLASKAVLSTLSVEGRENYRNTGFGVTRLAFRPDGTSLLIGVQPFKDFRVGRTLVIPTPGAEPTPAPKMPDAGFVATLEVLTGRSLSKPWEGGTIAIAPDADTILVRDDDGATTLIYDASKETYPLDVVADWGLGAFDREGKNFCLADGPTLTHVDAAGNMLYKATHPSVDCRFVSVAMSPDGERILTCDSDDAVMLWSPKSGRSLGRRFATIPGGPGPPPTPLAFIDGGQSLIAANVYSSTVLTWSEPALDAAATLQIGDGSKGLEPIAFCPSGRPEGVTALALLKNGSVISIGIGPGEGTFERLMEGATALATARLADMWAIGTAAGEVSLFAGSAPGRTGSCLPTGTAVKALALDPSGTILAACGSDGRVLVHGTSDLQPRVELVPPEGYGDGGGYTLSFSKDGCLLLGLGPGQAVLWDIATGALVGRFASVNQFYGSRMVGAFSPTEALFALASPSDPGIRLIRSDLVEAYASSLGLYRGSETAGGVSGLAFSPDGRRLAAVYESDDLVVWDLSRERVRGEACQVANRNLTAAEWARYLPSEPYRETSKPKLSALSAGG